MGNVRLTNKVDLEVYFEADVSRFDSEWIHEQGLSKERFIEYMSNCPSMGFEINGKPVGGAIFNHWVKEVHVAVLPEYQGRWGTLIAPTFKWLFSMHDFFYASVDQGNMKCIRFHDHIGSERIREDAKWIRYKVTRTEQIKRLLARTAEVNLTEPSSLTGSSSEKSDFDQAHIFQG